MTNQYPLPAKCDRDDFLFFLFFGPGSSPDAALTSIVKRAYRDLNRTLHGVTVYSKAGEEARDFLCDELFQLIRDRTLTDQTAFDLRHQVVCERLIAIYSEAGYKAFHLGQAQKWLNMALKYALVCGGGRLPERHDLFALAHVPIDRYILASNEFKGLAHFGQPWSRIDDYDKYLDFQKEVRKKFEGSAPLAVEFVVWKRMAEKVSRSA